MYRKKHIPVDLSTHFENKKRTESHMDFILENYKQKIFQHWQCHN